MPIHELNNTIGGNASNTYADLESAENYLDSQLNSKAWTNANPDDKKRALLMAAARIDFTGPVETFDDETKNVYFRLRRVALMANDGSKLPDDKVYTEAQVIEILGEDYTSGLVIDKRCCG